jgi:hypothetical protein
MQRKPIEPEALACPGIAFQVMESPVLRATVASCVFRHVIRVGRFTDGRAWPRPGSRVVLGAARSRVSNRRGVVRAVLSQKLGFCRLPGLACQPRRSPRWLTCAFGDSPFLFDPPCSQATSSLATFLQVTTCVLELFQIHTRI